MVSLFVDPVHSSKYTLLGIIAAGFGVITRNNQQSMRDKTQESIEASNRANPAVIELPLTPAVKIEPTAVRQKNEIAIIPNLSKGDFPDLEVPAIQELACRFKAVVDQVSKQLFGMQQVIHRTLVALLTGGHLLFEGNPGLGKTQLVKIIAQCTGLNFKRGQFTPDLLPSDITGDRIFDQRDHTFRFLPGPIFSHLFLADEINRAPAKTQAALLEAMQELQVTIAGTNYELGHQEACPESMEKIIRSGMPLGRRIFVVLATQNPMEQAGTYALPEAQLDRFLMRIFFHYPEEQVIRKIIDRSLASEQAPSIQRLFGFRDLCTFRKTIHRNVKVPDAVRDLIARIIEGSHRHNSIVAGASPRAAQSLLRCSQANAALNGRTTVSMEDVREMSFDVLNHRILLSDEAYYEFGERDVLHQVRNIIKEVVKNSER
jgi:MoxR-like ATPase